MTRITGTPPPNEPATEAEWQEAVDAAYATALIITAVRLGLLEAGPTIDPSRCQRLIRQGRDLGFTPQRDAVVGIVTGLVSDPQPGLAKRFAERLYEQLQPSESRRGRD